MGRYPCLVLDHDDTVVQSMEMSYDFFLYILEQFRPGTHFSLEEYILDCHNLGFVGMCRQRFGFTDAELKNEHSQWMAYLQTHVPDRYPGIENVIRRQKEEGGLLCVVSHSSYENISRDYRVHFGFQPDAIYGANLPAHQRKPSPWPLEDIMQRYNLKPSDILVVDDMKLACTMAAPLGVEVAFAKWSGLGVEEITREMESLCAYSFDSTKALYDFLFQEKTV